MKEGTDNKQFFVKHFDIYEYHSNVIPIIFTWKLTHILPPIFGLKSVSSYCSSPVCVWSVLSLSITCLLTCLHAIFMLLWNSLLYRNTGASIQTLTFQGFERKEKHKGRFDLFVSENLTVTLSLSPFFIGTAWLYRISDLTSTGHFVWITLMDLIIESLRLERSPRLCPTFDQTPSCQLNHSIKYHIQLFLEHLLVWWFHNLLVSHVSQCFPWRNSFWCLIQTSQVHLEAVCCHLLPGRTGQRPPGYILLPVNCREQ